MDSGAVLRGRHWTYFAPCCLLIIAIAASPMFFLQREPLPVGCYDLRKNRAEKDYFVIVTSRDGDVSSHTFVTWQHNEPGKSNPIFKSVGFYAHVATMNVDAVLQPDGQLLDENEIFRDYTASGREPPNARTAVVFWLDRSQFEASQSVLRAWEPAKKYQLLVEDCVTFAADVLRWFGLKVPVRIFAISPHAFIRSVLEMNGNEEYKCE